jgi:hypothetical protein
MLDLQIEPEVHAFFTELLSMQIVCRSEERSRWKTGLVAEQILKLL